MQIASVQSFARQLGRLGQADLIVIDEAHHAVASTWRTVLAAFAEAKILGVTATAARLDGKGLGVAAGGISTRLFSARRSAS